MLTERREIQIEAQLEKIEREIDAIRRELVGQRLRKRLAMIPVPPAKPAAKPPTAGPLILPDDD